MEIALQVIAMIACPEYTAAFKRYESVKEDETAYKEMFLRFYPLLLNYLLLHSISKPEAERIVSDAFIELWRRRNKQRSKDIKLYLFKKIENEIESHKNKLNGSYAFSINADVLNQCISLPSASEEFVKKLQMTIYSLSPENLLIFFLAKECGFKFVEISELMGKPVQTIENGLANVVRSMAESFAKTSYSKQPLQIHELFE
jgi:DNA-directed RNA polymerase specialized sigma24 family protein